jgi:hypothetical protein
MAAFWSNIFQGAFVANPAHHSYQAGESAVRAKMVASSTITSERYYRGRRVNPVASPFIAIDWLQAIQLECALPLDKHIQFRFE